MIHRITVAGLTLAALLLSASAVAAQSAPEMFHGAIVDTPQVSRGTATFFTLQVDRWGTEEEAQAYLKILKEKGQEALIEAFRDAESSGFIQVGSHLGYPIIFARVIPTAEGRMVRAFTDRPIQFFEARNSLRSLDYPLGIIEIRFDPKNKGGKGEGALAPAVSAKFDDKGQLEVEQYGSTPFKLLNITAKPVKEKKKK